MCVRVCMCMRVCVCVCICSYEYDELNNIIHVCTHTYRWKSQADSVCVRERVRTCDVYSAYMYTHAQATITIGASVCVCV